MSQTSIRAARLKTVQGWLKKSDWLPDTTDFDYATHYEHARRLWYPEHLPRAKALVAQAARRLRGETVKGAGAPVRFAWLRVPVGSVLAYQRQSVDLTTNELRPVTVLNGNGREIELQDGNGVIISIYVPDE